MKLYRGVNIKKFEQDGKILKAKGKTDKLEFYAGDDTLKVGNEILTINPSVVNAVYAHNGDWDKDDYKNLYKETSAALISLTTDIDLAFKFATYAYSEDGIIFEIELSDSIYNKIAISTSHPYFVNDHEREIVINLIDYDLKIPDEWIVNKIYVSKDDIHKFKIC